MYRWKWWIPAVAGCLLAIPSAAQSDLPDGPGKAVVERICGGCHASTVITQSRATKDHWEGVVENMVSRGAQGTDDELDRVVEYLAKNFGPAAAAGQKINVNRATTAEIAKTLTMSQQDADAIVQYRSKNGNFKNLESLKSVPGIDAKKIEEKKDWIEF